MGKRKCQGKKDRQTDRHLSKKKKRSEAIFKVIKAKDFPKLLEYQTKLQI